MNITLLNTHLDFWKVVKESIGFLTYCQQWTCLSPKEICESGDFHNCLSKWQQGIDVEQMEKLEYQQPIRYLNAHKLGMSLLHPESFPTLSNNEWLQTALEFCGIIDPSWHELTMFLFFMNEQIENFKCSGFCSEWCDSILPGFSNFVLKFLLIMSSDFATRSLEISDQSHLLDKSDAHLNINCFDMKRKWESTPHPYLFFNSDKSTFTFMGFKVNSEEKLVNPYNGEPFNRDDSLKLPRCLVDGLKTNKVNLNEDFDSIPRSEKLKKMCLIMGIGFEEGFDPDKTYELTADNVKKILAIHMRLKCKIPVIIMGETGCGKTRLVRFMCRLYNLSRFGIQNMKILKIHGGTTEEYLCEHIEKAVELSKSNRLKHSKEIGYDSNMETILFLDEVNSTEAIGLVKEVMIDGRLHGDKIDFSCGLRIVAACNPYRKHPESTIEKLEKSGLGYKVRQNDTTDVFGTVPMRQLVYRVQPMPNSLLPLVWDFGKLSSEVETLYIKQMLLNTDNELLTKVNECVDTLCEILEATHEFMRQT